MTRDTYRRSMMILGALCLTSAVACAHSGGAQPGDRTAGSEPVTWHDGTTKRTVWLRPDLVAEFHDGEQPTRALREPAPFNELVHESGGASIWKAAEADAPALAALSSASTSGSRYSQVFQDLPNGGRLRALPGNVIVTLNPALSGDEIEEWARMNGQRIVATMRYGRNIVVVESAPGLASLELANQLREWNDVVAAEPNWWQETSAR